MKGVLLSASENIRRTIGRSGIYNYKIILKEKLKKYGFASFLIYQIVL